MSDLVNWVKLQCKRVTPDQMIADELIEAHVELLKAERLREYADSQVAYNKNRMKRLNAYKVTVEESV